jgi:hypothetical protein
MTLAHVLQTVWLAVILIETALFMLLLWRKAYHEYPGFFTFVSFSVFRSLLLLCVTFVHPAWFRLVQWAAYVPQLAILVAVVIEVLYLLFHPFRTLPRNTAAHFLGATGTVVLFAIAFAATHPGAQATAWATFATAMDQAVSWIFCAVFMLVALFSTYFGIPWRHRLYGIGLGFLLYLSTDVAVTTIIAQFRLPPFSLLRLLDMIAFLVSCVIWTYYFFAPEVARAVPTCEQVEEMRAIVGRFAGLLPTKEG